MKSSAATVDTYLAELPADRREALAILRKRIREHVPDATETMEYGMASYQLGGSMLFALASQKAHMGLYVCETDVVEAHRHRLGKLDCGKGCIRFKKIANLPLDVIEDILREATARRRS